jgi:acetyltransferase-like isoleucine patch superfamily enzyme
MGNFGIFYLNSTIAHDCIIEDFVTVLPGANISGNVKLSMGAYIGANTCVLQGKSVTEKLIIGKYSIVGAGAVVTKNVPDNTIVKGIPAK